MAAFPLPRRWYQAPIEYEVFVEVVEVTEEVRPGLRAKVEIFVDRQEDQLQVPLSSLVNRGNSRFVYVKRDDDVELREVEIGNFNDAFVIILSGVSEGEEVLIDPDRFEEQSESESESEDDALVEGT